MFAITMFLLPAVLAAPSYDGHRHGHHSHWPSGFKAYKSGDCHKSAGIFPSGRPFGSTNASAQAAVTTSYQIEYTTIYETASGVFPAASEAATAVSPSGCGGTVTVTAAANTVTVTLAESEAGTSAANSSPAPVASALTSSFPKPVAPIAEQPLPSAGSSTTTASSTPLSVTPLASSTPAVATSSAAAATSASPEGRTVLTPPPGSKRGLFIPTSTDGTQDDYVKAFNAMPGKISWIVNQFSGPPGGLSSAFNFVPQCYDKLSDVNGDWTINAKNALKIPSEKYWLAFGEAETPNVQGFQMDASEAADEFMKLLNPYAVSNGINIGSPGTLAMPSDLQWQNDFLDECHTRGCKISWVSGHWFQKCGTDSAATLAGYMLGTIEDYKNIAKNHSAQYGIEFKVWMDNFSLDCDSQTISDFLDIVVPKMDADPMIERYGYVSNVLVSQANGFLNTDGSMSDLGKHYATM